MPGEFHVAAVAEELSGWDAMLHRLKGNLEKAQQQMVKFANRHRRELEFSVGDRVFLKVGPYCQISIKSQTHHKLAAKFYGPFEIEHRVGPSAYRLKLPDSSRIHPVFHVSQLRLVLGEHPVDAELPLSLEIPVSPLLEPESVLAVRSVQEEGKHVTQILIKWERQSKDDTTWMEVEQFQKKFPDFNFEDMVVSKRQGVVREQEGERVELAEEGMPRPLQVYRRRGRA